MPEPSAPGRAAVDPSAPIAGPGADAAVGFVRLLRAADLPVTVHHTREFATALAVVGWEDAGTVYWTARATLGVRPEHLGIFDAAFLAWFDDLVTVGVAEIVLPPAEVVIALDAPETDAAPLHPDNEADDGPVVTVWFSAAETLRERDFATYTAAEHAETRRLLADVRIAGALRRSRRLRAHRHTTRRPDLRATVRAALRTDGETVARPGRTPTVRPRRLVVLCDVSGSMEPYARVIVRFLHTAVVGRARVEAFVLGTRLTRITRELTNRDPDVAIAAAARRVADWSGGTRLGETLREFNQEWGIRGLARGADVVIVSDGWDRGDPELLGEQMARLARVAHRIIWVNPLKASPGYAPLAAGMAAALPHIDEFIEGHSLASLEELVRVVGSRAA